MRENNAKVAPLRNVQQGGWWWVENEALSLLAGKRLTLVGLAVYCVLCRHARHRGGQTWATLREIEQESGLSRSSVCQGIKNLETVGLIHKDKQRNRKGAWHTNRYDLLTLKPQRVGPAIEGDDASRTPTSPMSRNNTSVRDRSGGVVRGLHHG